MAGLAPAAALKQAKTWLRTATRRELIAYAKANFKPASAEAQAPDPVALLGGARRGEPTRSAAVWNALLDAGAARGRQAKGRKGRRKPRRASMTGHSPIPISGRLYLHGVLICPSTELLIVLTFYFRRGNAKRSSH